MDFTGQIKHIGEIQQFETKTGSCLSRDIVLETDEQFPRSACVTLRNDLAQSFNLNIGQRVRVDFDLYARPNKEGNRYFNQLTAWRISPC